MSSLLKTIPRLTKNSRVPSFSGSLPSVETSWEIHLSDLVFGEIIASGSFGTVYKGEYFGTECAIKKIFRNVMEEQDMRKFLERELAASKFSHPNIVGFIGIAESEAEEAIYLVTELMHTSLHAILRDMSDPLPWKRRVRLLLSGAKSLGYLHAKNIIHRDIKSRNMLIDDSGKLKICDFGFARKVVRGNKTMMTICGTDEYMAPEVILGDPYNDSADVYSFGVVICEVITRKSVKKTFPREPRNLFAFDFDKFKEELPSDCPTELSDFCVKCLATESDERPSFSTVISTLAEIDRNLHLNSPLSTPQLTPDHIGDFNRSVSTPKILITDNSKNNNNNNNNNNEPTKLAQSENLQEAMNSFNRMRAKSDSPTKKKLPGSIQDSNMDNLALQNLNLNFASQDQLNEIITDYFKSSKSLSGWVTLGYENDNTLEIQGHGSGGVDELLDSLANNQVQYSLLRLSYVSQDNIQKVRDVFIYWTGPNVSVVQRGKKKTHVGAVQQILKPFHADLLAYNKDNFTEEIILERSSPLSGSHVIE